MKRLYFILAVMFAMIGVFQTKAQTTIKLDATTHKTTIHSCLGFFYDNNPNGNYSNNQDYWMTFCPSVPGRRVRLDFTIFDVDQSDQMIIYEGVDTTASPMTNATANSLFFTSTDLAGQVIMAPPTDTSGCLTVRFKSNASAVSTGWKAKLTCEAKCQDVIADLDTIFIKYNSAGNMSTRPVRNQFEVDTTTGDTTFFKSVDFCIGDSIVLIAKPKFPYNNLAYHQSDSSCIYQWTFGDNEGDTVNYNTMTHHKYDVLTGYNLGLIVRDTTNGGCTSTNDLKTRVRVAKNPIKVVTQLPDMCSGETMQLNVGYTGNSSVVIDSIEFNRQATASYGVRTFIPDGDCGTGTNSCYESPVTFTDFTPGSTIKHGDDVKSVCIQMEHSWLDDLYIGIVCPNGQSTTFKYRTSGSSTYLGISNETDGYGSNKCDTNANPIGVCWNYCWSNQFLNQAQGVIRDDVPYTVLVPMIPSGTNQKTLDSTNVGDSTRFFQTPIQGVVAGTAQTSSPQATTTDLNGFNTLIGCPLNGTWKIKVCDTWGSDNGWVCGWSMTIGQQTSWTYQVPLDTVNWDGPFLHGFTQSTSLIQPPVDSSGLFTYNIHIIDDFGCVWDTITKLNVVKTPVVELGPDVNVCSGKSITLDAGNPGATAYAWEPTGEKTQTIQARPADNVVGNVTYKVQVTNYNGSLYCYGLDSVHVNVHPAATASFTMNKFPLEGCEPFTVQLLSTSSNADEYEWTIGEMSSNVANPTFTFPYGVYDLKLKVKSNNGCTDSISYNSIVNVYKSPKADFGWEPTTPYATDPTVHIVNLTAPKDATNQYHWSFQTNKHSASDIVNVFGESPSYTWAPQTGESVAGEYAIHLDAYSVNNSPSGNIYECHDTTTKVVTIINDRLMFPTVITPNGDGVNDVFEIHNLVDGQAFPDNELSIYNRYGKRIYFIQDLRSKSEYWDPNKTNTPTGTYFYRFIGRGPIRNVEFKGSVEVIR